jgi:putative ABC transport system permease protein
LYRTAGPASFPRIAVASVNWEVFVFACALALGVALLSGVAPAAVMMHLTRLGADGSARSATVSRPLRTSCRIFIGLQVAGSAALVVSMGLVTQSFIRLQHVDPGFDGRGARWVQLSLPPRAYPDRERIGRFADALRDRLLSMPGVRDAGAVSLMPLTGLLSTMDIAFPDRPPPAPDEVPQGHFRIATPGYFRAAGIPVLSGRTFTASDLARGRPVAIVSRSFASRHWPGEAAVGKTLQLVLAVPSAPLDVIGVVADVKQFGLDGSPTADVYVPLHQMPPQTSGLIAARMYWIVRTDDTARVSDESIREAVTAIDPQVAASAIRPLEDAVRASLGPRRLNVRLLEAFGLVAVLLSALGVYAVTSFSAGTRKRELAIRTALGAGRGQLRHLLVRDELRALAIGLIAGLLAAFLAAPALEPLLFDTNPANLPTYIVAGAVLLVVGLVASLVPARHASRTDPARLLRA